MMVALAKMICPGTGAMWADSSLLALQILLSPGTSVLTVLTTSTILLPLLWNQPLLDVSVLFC